MDYLIDILENLRVNEIVAHDKRFFPSISTIRDTVKDYYESLNVPRRLLGLFW